MVISQTIEYTSVDELLLDPKNPRIGRRNVAAELDQDQVLAIVQTWSVDELAVSFLENGFWPQEALVVVLDEEVHATKPVVVEGNRRLAALKLLWMCRDGKTGSKKWQELAKVAPDGLFTSIPYMRADKREDVRDYIGYRHVTGIKEWAPAEKAQYIADLVDGGMSYEEVMRSIGSKTPTVRRNYIAHRILLQSESLESVEVDKIEDRFSVLFLSLRERGVQEFLGFDPSADPEAAQVPVTGEEYIENLEFFVRWVFGTDEVPPLFSDSRFMTKFARILENDDAVDYLKESRSPSLAIAISKSGADIEDALAHMRAATDELEQALSTVHLYAANSDVASSVNRFIRGVDVLLNSFPDERGLLCDGSET